MTFVILKTLKKHEFSQIDEIFFSHATF